VGKAEKDGLFKHISTARFASRTLELEFEANTQTVIPYFASTFSVMALFSVVTCMMTDWVRSKPWLGLLGNVSAGMATVSAFGLCCYLGIDFIGINLAAPFLMIGKSSASLSSSPAILSLFHHLPFCTPSMPIIFQALPISCTRLH
jgi:hypothetical protein